jgi:hypothetical protein
LDEIDAIRHREITSKAVSAILLLVLKWFKVSREFAWNIQYHIVPIFMVYFKTDVMKFHHLGQLLLDTNCLLLILKMFGLQEVSASVLSKADSPENKFAVFWIRDSLSDGAAAFFAFANSTLPRILSPSILRMTCCVRHGSRSCGQALFPTDSSMRTKWSY